MLKVNSIDPATQGVKNGGTDIHLTPSEIIEALQLLWPDGIGLDPCSNEGTPNIPASKRYTISENGLIQDWICNTLFLNAPYSENKPWAIKFLAQLRCQNFQEAVVLNKNDNRVKSWFPVYQDNCNAFCIIKGGLKFGDAKAIAPFPSALWYFGPNALDFLRAFDHIGWCYRNFRFDGFANKVG